MKTTVVLSLAKEKGVFKPYLLRQEYENISLVQIKDSHRALKKFVSKLYDERVVIKCGEENSRIYSGRLRIYNDTLLETVLPVLEKILLQCGKKFSLSLPLEEICIIAPPPIACKIMECLSLRARMFTVVSEEDYVGKTYDEIYFKYGIPIRQISDFNNNLPESTIIINCDGKDITAGLRRPVINLANGRGCSNLCVNALNVHIEDDNILSMEKCWGGAGSLPLYHLMGEKPTKNAAININKKADEIFLLDTT